MKIRVEKTERAIMNEKSRDTCNIGNTTLKEDIQSKNKNNENTTQKTEKTKSTTTKTGDEPKDVDCRKYLGQPYCLQTSAFGVGM
jgi:hypothetical protein